MTLLKTGDRGPQVSQLQVLLNQKPTRLPLLLTDGVFGPKTNARVLEYQRDNGLKQDGIVGPVTMAQLQIVTPTPPVNLQAVMMELARLLDPPLQGVFLQRAQALLPQPNVFGATLLETPVIIIVLFFIIMMMIVLAQNSQNPANRRFGARVGTTIPAA